MRHRHRLSGVRRRRLAGPAHDPGLRSQRSVKAGPYSRFWSCRTGAGLHRNGADRVTWAISTGPQGNRVYFGYGTNKGGILQIVDREKLLNGPKEPTPENLRYPVVGRLDMLPFNGAHTVFPIPQMPVAEFVKDKDGKVRNFVMTVDEQILNECQEARQLVFFADVTTEAKPMVVSNFMVPEASGNFCQRGGRFGAHSSNESMAPVFYKKVAFIAYFNAGVALYENRRCGALQDRDSEQQCGNRRPRLHLSR